LGISKSDCIDFIANDEWPQFTQPQTNGLSALGAMLESYHKLQQKPKTVPKFKKALQVIWSASPQKATDTAEKDHHKRLQACVSANSYSEHLI